MSATGSGKKGLSSETFQEALPSDMESHEINIDLNKNNEVYTVVLSTRMTQTMCLVRLASPIQAGLKLVMPP